jgi:hypothetical protein
MLVHPDEPHGSAACLCAIAKGKSVPHREAARRFACRCTAAINHEMPMDWAQVVFR